MSVKIFDAPTVFKYLNGIIGIYKPAGKKIAEVRNAILYNLCKDLNELEVREPRRLLALGPGGVQNEIFKNIADLSDDILCVGPRYKIEDFKCRCVASLGPNTSGILLMGLNSGVALAHKIQKSRAVRCYHLTGKLGVSTENYLANSIVTARATYNHINEIRISSMVASLQASHQRKMYELCGVDMQSQAAYELACQGLIRPANNMQPVVYGIRLIDFKRPLFTLEVHAINETESFLATLIHEIGIELKSVAHCSALRCVRHGVFSTDDALLRKNWNLQDILDNMNMCRKKLKSNRKLLKQTDVKISEDLIDKSMKQINS